MVRANEIDDVIEVIEHGIECNTVGWFAEDVGIKVNADEAAVFRDGAQVVVFQDAAPERRTRRFDGAAAAVRKDDRMLREFKHVVKAPLR